MICVPLSGATACSLWASGGQQRAHAPPAPPTTESVHTACSTITCGMEMTVLSGLCGDFSLYCERRTYRIQSPEMPPSPSPESYLDQRKIKANNSKTSLRWQHWHMLCWSDGFQNFLIMVIIRKTFTSWLNTNRERDN